jgi:YD repeat-containing protein
LYRLTNKVSLLPNTQHGQDFAYTYDALGNITKIIDASVASTSKTMNYTYDDLARLTSASSTGAVYASNFLNAYTYDVLGNILTSPVGTSTYASTGYANPDAVTSISTGGGGSTSTSTPTYVQSAINSTATLGNLEPWGQSRYSLQNHGVMLSEW